MLIFTLASLGPTDVISIVSVKGHFHRKMNKTIYNVQMFIDLFLKTVGLVAAIFH